jgi:hypothetical protein
MISFVPTICRFHGIKIHMYFRDHNPPHFHAHYGVDKAEVLFDGTIKNGALAPTQLGLVREWALGRGVELAACWERASRGEAPGAITPLE